MLHRSVVCTLVIPFIHRYRHFYLFILLNRVCTTFTPWFHFQLISLCFLFTLRLWDGKIPLAQLLLLPEHLSVRPSRHVGHQRSCNEAEYHREVVDCISILCVNRRENQRRDDQRALAAEVVPRQHFSLRFRIVGRLLSIRQFTPTLMILTEVGAAKV